MSEPQMPRTALEAIRYFADEGRCHEFLASLRWKDGVCCPRCKSKEIGKLMISSRVVRNKDGREKCLVRRLWRCKTCKQQFTVKVGTIFEDSPLGLDKWLPAVWFIVNAKNGISSCELARALGITQKSAWHMGHRIRLALHEGSFEKMSGHVEADEPFIGAKARNMHKHKREEKIKGTGGYGKTAVMGLLERTSRDKFSRVKLKVLRTTKRHELQGHVREYVLKGSALSTDALASYTGLSEDYVHRAVDHAVRYVEDKVVHTNGLENFWSLLKRALRGTYVCPHDYHLFRYLDEQAFRFNERQGEDGDRFGAALRQVEGRNLSYERLIGKNRLTSPLLPAPPADD